jgi:hypothetical protein
MDSLKRKMFQNGGEARVIQSGVYDAGSVRNPKTEIRSIEEQNGVFYSRVRDRNGNLKREEIIDLSLSANRDPIEALNIQKRNAALRGTAEFVTTAPALLSGLGGLGYLGGREIVKRGLGRKISDIFFKRDPGKVTGKYGTERLFAGQGPISGLTGTGAAGVGIGLGATIGAALRSMQQDPVEPEVAEEPKTKVKGNMGQTFGTKKDEPEVIQKFKDQPLVSKVISSPDFNRFLSNLSSSLTATGSFAQGAAQAASDSFEQKLQGVDNVLAVETSDAERNRKVNQEILGNLNEFEQTERNLSRLEYAITLVDEGATGLPGLFGKGWTQFLSTFNQLNDTDFDKLDARTKADAILTALRQQDIRNILGESGRTISNLDREIVADIFGSIKVTSSPAEIKSKLREIALRYRKGLKRNRNEILAGMDYFSQTRMPSSVLESNLGGLSNILRIQDFDNYQAPAYDPTSEGYGEYAGGDITDIEYVEGT